MYRCDRRVRSCFENITHLLSGEIETDPIRPMSLEATVAVLPSATLWLYSFLSDAL